jgi:hypothetical protein
MDDVAGPRSREDLAYAMALYAWMEETLAVPESFFDCPAEVEIARSLTDEEKHEAWRRSAEFLAKLAKAEAENDPQAAAYAREVAWHRRRPPWDEAPRPQTRTTPRPGLGGRRVPRARAPRPRQAVRRKARTAARTSPSSSQDDDPDHVETPARGLV